MLLSKEIKKPVVNDKFPHINFKLAWQAGCIKFVSSRPRELNWRIIHNVVPVNAYLFRLQIIRNAICPLCRWPETLTHRFFSCRSVCPLWNKVETWIQTVTGTPFKVTPDFVIFLQDARLADPMHTNLLLILGAELKFVIWVQRNRVKYDKKVITTEDIQLLFLHAVKTRIRADFLRLDSNPFTRL